MPLFEEGSGVPELFSVWEKEGWIEPTIEENIDPDRTILTMQFVKKTAGKKVREEICGQKSARKNTSTI